MTGFNLAPKSDFVFAELHETEGMLLSLKTKSYFKLNETALCFWKLISKGLTEIEIVEEFEKMFEASSASIRTDLHAFVKKLQSEGFLVAETRSANSDHHYQQQLLASRKDKTSAS